MGHDDFERWTHYTVMVTGAEDLEGNATEQNSDLESGEFGRTID